MRSSGREGSNLGFFLNTTEASLGRELEISRFLQNQKIEISNLQDQTRRFRVYLQGPVDVTVVGQCQGFQGQEVEGMLKLVGDLVDTEEEEGR